MKRLVIWHTNDVHSRFEAFCGISRYLKEHAGPADLILDAGDFCDMMAPMITGTGGLGGIHLLQQAGYDALAIGNNEFFAGAQCLENMAAAGLPLLSCNLKYKDGRSLANVRSHLILEKNGIRVLIIGVSPYWDPAPGSNAFLDMIGLCSLDTKGIIPNILEQEKGSYDIAVLLSHAGDDHDCRLCTEVRGLDVIIAAHLHRVYDPQECHGVWIQESGCYGRYLGRMELTLDERSRLTAVSGENLANDFAPDAAAQQMLAAESRNAEAVLEKPLYQLPRLLTFHPYRECLLVNAVADALHRKYGGDFGMINNGIVNNELDGAVSRLKLLETAPSYLNPTAVTWSGRQIREAVKASFDQTVIHSAGHGPGYRGRILGTLSFSDNVRVQEDPLEIRISGAPLAEDRFYRVITDDYLQRGSGYPMLYVSREDTVYYDGYIRDLMAETFADREWIQSIRLGRVHYAGPERHEKREGI
jgi:5'-nucleotidase